MLERALGAGVVDVNEVIAEQVQTPTTLAGVLNGVDLRDPERRSVLAADAMQVPLEMKGVLLGADIFLRDGIFRAEEVLGFDRDQAVGARDSVRTDPEYEIPWIQFNQLREDNFAEVAIYKRARMTHSQIAKILGIDTKEVDRISQHLVGFGIYPRRNSKARRFDSFCRLVEEKDKIAQGKPMSTKDLADELSTTPLRVSRARQRNRYLARASTPGQEGVARQGSLIRNAIISHPGFSDQEIIDLLEKNGQHVSLATIKHRRIDLIKEGLVRGKRRGKSQESQGRLTIPTKTEEAEAILRKILGEYLEAKQGVVIAHLKRDVPEFLNVPPTTLIYLYHKIAKDSDVPSLTHSRRK